MPHRSGAHHSHHHHHGAGPDRLAQLPDAILIDIFEAVNRLSKRDLCAVSRLNKRYHVLADAVLYKTVHFLTPELHLIFSESLSRRPRRGSSIQAVKLAYPASKLSSLISRAPIHGSQLHQDHPPLPFDSLSRTISTMSNLETLDVAVPDSLLHGMGLLFNGPFDLACLKSCTLFYQTDDDGYWDLQENIHIFAHPTLETLVIKKAKLDYRGFDLIEQPHETALSKLHLIECDINDDALSDLLMFPKALKEFLETLEFFNELGTDPEVTDLFVYALENLQITARKLKRLIVVEGENGIPKAIEDAVKTQPQLKLDIIGSMDDRSDAGTEEETEGEESEKNGEGGTDTD
ncbi:unnamed protein product [Clonostachys rosea]|uniref:F-box domain-containing protein n=1 Tax=Bionectria ochroleuca TaxID=29856 RepID=A0ABY6UML7_BIOOC|nr:unnamed protein product [Clonostachys rosea]